MTTTDRRARERQVHASVVVAATLAWAGSAYVVFDEMRATEAAEKAAEEARWEALAGGPAPAGSAVSPAGPAPRSSAAAVSRTASASSPAAPAPRASPAATLAAAGLRPAAPPRRKVVVVRRSRAS